MQSHIQHMTHPKLMDQYINSTCHDQCKFTYAMKKRSEATQNTVRWL